MKFAENIESETDRFICFAKHFEGRHIRNQALWAQPIFPDLKAFLEDPCFRAEEHHLLLECHLSLAFAAGYLLHRRSGAYVYPVQKGWGAPQVWKPSPPSRAAARTNHLSISREDGCKESQDIVVAVSISNDVIPKVRAYLRRVDLRPRAMLGVHPVCGPGQSSLQSADEAIWFAEELHREVTKARNNLSAGGTLHLFISAPAGFVFLLGRLGHSLGHTVLYEYDFEATRGGGYEPSLSFNSQPSKQSHSLKEES
jgi:hypothetical protein